MQSQISGIQEFQYLPVNSFVSDSNTGSAALLSGWALHITPQASITASSVVQFSCTFSGTTSNSATLENWYFIDDQGTTHSFPGSLIKNKCLQDPGISSWSGYASDGSGYFLSITNYVNAKIYAPNGEQSSALNTQYFPAVEQYGQPAVPYKDANGNYVSTVVSTAATFIVDELGRTPLVSTAIATDSAGNPTEIDFSLPNGSGNSSTYRAVVSNIPVYTALSPYPGASNYIEYQGTLSVITQLTLPNGTAYHFTYDQGTDAGHFGTVSSMTLPAGGIVSYTFGVATIPFVNGSTTTNTTDLRLSTKSSYDGGSWALGYQYKPTSSGTGAEVVTVTSPSTNDTVYTFGVPSDPTNAAGIEVPTSIDTYQGSDSARSRLQTKSWFYGGLPMPTSEILTLNDGRSATTSFSWDTNNYFGPAPNLTQKQVSGFSGEFLSESDYTYVTDPTYTTIHMTNLLKSSITYGGPNQTVKVAETTYGYDEGGLAQASGFSNHDDSGYGVGFISRGNLTSISQWVSGSSYANHTMKYDILGNVLSEIDPNLGSTTYNYTDQWAGSSGCGSMQTNAYRTGVTNALGQHSSIVYACTGDVSSVRDPNDLGANRAGTVQAFNADGSLASVSYPDGGLASYSYTATSSTVTKVATPSPSISSTINYDGVGRVSQTNEAGAITDYGYNTDGKLRSTSNPHGTSSAPTDGTSSLSYDALGRIIRLDEADGSFARWSYPGTVIDSFDESDHHRQRTYDALGRLTKVLEPDGSNNPTLETDYQYDALNNLTRVDQWGGLQGSPGDRVRIFNYDGLSHLTFSSNPESGTTSYGYDANGNLTSKTDARGVTVGYGYDALNRVVSKSSSGAGGVPGFSYVYQYDQGGVGSNSIGRLNWATNDVNADIHLSYDPMGRIAHQSGYSQSDTSGSGNAVSVQYDLAGNIASITYPDGRVVNQTWNGAGNLTQVTDGTGYSYLLPQTSYYPNGSPSVVYYGNGVGNGYVLNNRLQMEEQGIVRVGSIAPGNYPGNNNLSVKEYCYGPATSALSSTIPGCPSLGGNANNGAIWQIMDTLTPNKTQSFSYDSLDRITHFAQADGGLQQTYAYDSFGNLNQTDPGTLTNNLGFNANNQINSGDYGYDAAGNINAVFNGVSTVPYNYDAENKLVSANGGLASYSYDPNGNRVRKDVSPDWTEYVVFNGQNLAERNSDGTWSDYIYANGQRIARADNYDVRIHMSGTNCSGCSSTNTFAGTQSLTALNGIVIQNGDLLTWRQYQSGVASGGISLGLGNGTTGTSGVLRAVDGQLTDADTRTNNWFLRVADLSAYAGTSIFSLNAYNFVGGAPGDWNIWLADISLVHPDGTVIPVYHRGLGALSQFTPGAAESNVSVITEKNFNEPNPLAFVTYYSGDQIGSTRIVTDSGGWSVSSEIYYPFGQEPNATGGPDHYKFTGKERDTESGLDYSGARFYLSAVGRFMSPDPLNAGADPNNPQSWNMYSYVLNNPLSLTDPLGLGPCDQKLHRDQEITVYANGDTTETKNNVTSDNGYSGCGTIQPGLGGGPLPQSVTSTTVNKPPANPHAPNNGCQTGFNIGGTAGVDGAVGVVAGGAATGGGAAGVTFGGGHPNVYASATGGAAVWNKGVPSQTNGPSIVFGGGAGASAGVTFGNATQASQMSGSALTFGAGVDVGVGGGVQVSLGTDAAGHTIWQVSILGGVGLKAYGYALTTKTAAAGTGTPCTRH
jgi:RHS repeat-associated protein